MQSTQTWSPYGNDPLSFLSYNIPTLAGRGISYANWTFSNIKHELKEIGQQYTCFTPSEARWMIGKHVHALTEARWKNFIWHVRQQTQELVQADMERRTSVYFKKGEYPCRAWTFQAVKIDDHWEILVHIPLKKESKRFPKLGDGSNGKVKTVIRLYPIALNDLLGVKIHALKVSQKETKVVDGESYRSIDQLTERKKHKDQVNNTIKTEGEIHERVQKMHSNVLRMVFHGALSSFNVGGKHKNLEFSRRQILLEYCPLTLNQYLYSQSSGRIEDMVPPTSIWIAKLLNGYLECLCAMHARGAFHMDLKGDNLFVQRFASPKVGDFSSSLLIEDLNLYNDPSLASRLWSEFHEKLWGTRKDIPPKIKQDFQATLTDYCRGQSSLTQEQLFEELGKFDVWCMGEIFRKVDDHTHGQFEGLKELASKMLNEIQDERLTMAQASNDFRRLKFIPYDALSYPTVPSKPLPSRTGPDIRLSEAISYIFRHIYVGAKEEFGNPLYEWLQRLREDTT